MGETDMVIFTIIGVLSLWLFGLVAGANLCANIWDDELGGMGAFWTYAILYMFITSGALGYYLSIWVWG